MSWENKNRKKIKEVERITKNINKKGKIKGKNKKETKFLKVTCPHHYYNRKGKLKPMFFNTNDGYCVCEKCGAKIPTKIEDKATVKDYIEPVIGVTDQAITMAVSAGLSDKAVTELTAFKIGLNKFPKLYKKISTAVSREENLRCKKNKGRKGGGGSSQYGNWNNR